MSLQRTIVNNSISYLSKNFPCVAILGARQVGKTTFMRDFSPNGKFFDFERISDLERFRRDPEFFLSQDPDRTLVIDEAQLEPSLFPALRVAIDQMRDKKGRFLISGSSSPLLNQNIHESLAGRIAVFELPTLTLEERYQKPPSEFFDLIVSGKKISHKMFSQRYTEEELFSACVFGGYPEPFLKHSEDPFFEIWMENYFRSYIQRDVRDLFPGIQTSNYQRLIQMLAISSGEIINASNFARSIDVSQPTIKNYLRIAEGTFIWKNLESYDRNVTKRVSKMPKGYVRDSGLLNFLLRIRSREDFLNHPHAGRIWEAFITEELINGFTNRLHRISTFYYRTKDQAEIDLILETRSGILPIEIKLGKAADPRKIQTLDKFVREQKLPYGLLINNSESPEWITPQVLQIPAGFI